MRRTLSRSFANIFDTSAFSHIRHITILSYWGFCVELVCFWCQLKMVLVSIKRQISCMHQHSLILGLCIPKTHCGLTVSTCFCRCAHQGSSRVIESIFVVQAFEAFTVQYIALEKYESFANLYIQGVFLTGTPLKSSKYKKVNLGKVYIGRSTST